MINLGEVGQEIADQERFITNIVVEEDSERGITKRIPTTTFVALKDPVSVSASSSTAMTKGNSAVTISSEKNSSTMKKVLLWTGGIVGAGLVIGALSSFASL